MNKTNSMCEIEREKERMFAAPQNVHLQRFNLLFFFLSFSLTLFSIPIYKTQTKKIVIQKQFQQAKKKKNNLKFHSVLFFLYCFWIKTVLLAIFLSFIVVRLLLAFLEKEET